MILKVVLTICGSVPLIVAVLLAMTERAVSLGTIGLALTSVSAVSLWAPHKWGMALALGIGVVGYALSMLKIVPGERSLSDFGLWLFFAIAQAGIMWEILDWQSALLVFLFSAIMMCARFDCDGPEIWPIVTAIVYLGVASAILVLTVTRVEESQPVVQEQAVVAVPVKQEMLSAEEIYELIRNDGDPAKDSKLVEAIMWLHTNEQSPRLGDQAKVKGNLMPELDGAAELADVKTLAIAAIGNAEVAQNVVMGVKYRPATESEFKEAFEAVTKLTPTALAEETAKAVSLLVKADKVSYETFSSRVITTRAVYAADGSYHLGYEIVTKKDCRVLCVTIEDNAVRFQTACGQLTVPLKSSSTSSNKKQTTKPAEQAPAKQTPATTTTTTTTTTTATTATSGGKAELGKSSSGSGGGSGGGGSRGGSKTVTTPKTNVGSTAGGYSAASSGEQTDETPPETPPKTYEEYEARVEYTAINGAVDDRTYVELPSETKGVDVVSDVIIDQGASPKEVDNTPAGVTVTHDDKGESTTSGAANTHVAPPPS